MVLLLPTELVPVMVYVVVDNTAVGVPEIIPVFVSKDNPAGNGVFIE